ncbi:unnamed protein product [Hyaloperonospora brassicae]|uniref:COMM domain-containing protein n=1 Tax=Hyaloperonospora brassicae TaxID=162125 RepID=A0AAV0U197_HYABA|nr:unnamed protein product [Hyaloperonospora brassicae]
MTSRGVGAAAIEAKAVTSLGTAHSFVVLNAVAHNGIGHVLTRVLNKMAVNASEVYTDREKHPLQSLLGLEIRQIDEVVDVAKCIFRDAAMFGHVDRNLLLSRGADGSVVRAVEEAWKEVGSVVAERIAAAREGEGSSLVLQKTGWRLHLQMGSSKRAGHLQPTAIFQLDVVDEASISKLTEKLDVELSHEELRSLFLQLNAVQAELDGLPTPSAYLAQ